GGRGPGRRAGELPGRDADGFGPRGPEPGPPAREDPGALDPPPPAGEGDREAVERDREAVEGTVGPRAPGFAPGLAFGRSTKPGRPALGAFFSGSRLALAFRWGLSLRFGLAQPAL